MDATLFEALARATKRHMGDFKTQELANTAWVFVTAGQVDVALFKELARVAERRIGDFKPQELANTA